MRLKPAVLRALLFALATGASHAAEDRGGRTVALPPEQALAAFRIEDGLRIELVAAEPLVVDPVAFAFDDRGRLFVVENRGYPEPIGGTPVTHEGRIALLEDTDHDGRYDRRTEFATGLTYPNGIMIWRGGIFVTCAPDILYLKDTDGDGVADKKKVVLTGFETSKTTQLRVSHPTLGLDGKIYVTSGLTGGQVTSPEHPERAPVVFSPMDGRFDPATLIFENTGGRGQFGLTFDAYGRRFNCSNRHPVSQVVLEPWQLQRNPYLASTDMVQDVSKVEAQAKVFPLSHANVSSAFNPRLLGANHAGTFTSACGVTVFGGTALAAEHRGNVFICEPAQNLVQRQVLLADGATFHSEPPYQGREFLASTDSWFRPVYLGGGPDGALYVADMHRREIDHPQYVPEESRGKLDFVSGKGRGRIYRITVVAGARAARPAFAMSSPADLCRQLEAPDAWWRDRAFRLLLERSDTASVPLLEKSIRAAKEGPSRARALWCLHDLGKLSAEMVLVAWRDRDPGVREQAARLTEDMLAGNANLVAPLLAGAADADARVRFATALVLGSWNDARAIPALTAIARRDGQDRWTRTAVLSGIGGRMREFFEAFEQESPASSDAVAAVLADLGRIFGAGGSADACRVFSVRMLGGEDDFGRRVPAILGLLEGLRGRKDYHGPGAGGSLKDLVGHDHGSVFGKFVDGTAALALDEKAPPPLRMNAVALLGFVDFSRAAPVLAALLDARQPPEIQVQAVRALDRIGDRSGGELLVQRERWQRYTPQVREAVMTAMLSKPATIEVLFEAIRTGVLKASEVSSPRRSQLQKHANSKIRAAAVELFRELEAGDRMKVYQANRAILDRPADAKHGGEVFLRVCSACHTYEGIGGNVGPDLTGVRNQPADALLLHILVPNYEVSPGYQSVAVTTQDGQSFSGWMSAETAGSITLRTAFGTDETVLRPNIKSLVSSGVSLMPDGLEQTMKKGELADLIAYLKAGNP